MDDMPRREAPSRNDRVERSGPPRLGCETRTAGVVAHWGTLSTATVTTSGRIVPWLAAGGPLSHSPEEPPDDDYYFRSGWVVLEASRRIRTLDTTATLERTGGSTLPSSSR